MKIQYILPYIRSFGGARIELKPLTVHGDTEEVTLSALVARFKHCGWQISYVASFPKETINTAASGSFYPMFNPAKYLQLRPLAILDDEGRWLTREEVQSLVENYRMPKRVSDYGENSAAFWRQPVPYTCSHANCDRHVFRSTRSMWEVKKRSTLGNHSWKRTKCRKQWMKHKGNDPVESIRTLLIEDTDEVFDEILEGVEDFCEGMCG